MSGDPLLGFACQLRDALYVKMAECGAKPCKIFLSPTPATPIDDCCDCGDGDGQAWVAIITAKPKYDNFAGFSPCVVETEVMFVLGISRCASTIDDQGNPPSADDLNADSEKLTRDFGIMRQAIDLFAIEAGIDKQMYRYGDYDVHPVRGGCIAATHEVWVTFDCLTSC